MFTGIVEALAEVKSISKNQYNVKKNKKIADTILCLDIKKISKGLKIGSSISVNGACLTISKLNQGIATFELVGETIRKTNFNTIKVGDRLNVERSLMVSDRFEGHFVLGHVDGTGTISKKQILKNETKLWIKLNEENLNNFIVSKGSITLDGISLTVVDVKKDIFSVSLIPYTLENTNFGQKKIGDTVNIEVDVIARYLSQLLPK